MHPQQPTMPDTSSNYLRAAAPGVNASVSAAAGTGKTWLLVARLLRLLLDGESPASILAITFTQKTAAEIRQRLTAILSAWTRLDTADLKTRLREIGAPSAAQQLRCARNLYETLIYAENDIRIVTFHSFCREILERFAPEAGVPPQFEICTEEWALQNEALNQLYIRAAADNPANTQLREALSVLFETCNGLSNTDQALRNFLSRRNDWLAYIDGRADPTAAAVGHLSAALGVNADEIEARWPLGNDTLRLLERHAQMISKHNNKTCARQAEQITTLLTSIENSGDKTVNSETLSQLLKCFFTKNSLRQQFANNTFLKTLNEQFKDFMINLEQLTHTLRTGERMLLKRQAFRRNRAWYIAGQYLATIYQTLKTARRQLDFNDLEWQASKLINSKDQAAWIQYRLNEQIRHILVDEFQDTNPQQWQLLKPLLEEIAAQEGGGSAFIVGDPKQSIYGFRRANPALYGEAKHWLASHMRGQDYDTSLSRRSSPAVIDFVNRVFTPSDSDTPTPKLTDFTTHATSLGNMPGSITFMPFIENEKSDNTKKTEAAPVWRDILRDPPPTPTPPAALREGEQIARHIRDLVDRRVAVYDRDGRPHSLCYGDIMILLRARTPLDHYEHAFRQAGIPYNSGRANRMFGSQEISDMLALLEFLCDYERDLDLAQVLRSPLFSVSDRQLVMLSRNAHPGGSPDGDSRGDCWFMCLAHVRNDAVLQRAHQLLSSWIEAARTLPPHDLLDLVYHSGDTIRRYRCAAPGNEEQLAEQNLLQLLNYSLDFDSGRYPHLAAFTRHLKQRIAQAYTDLPAAADEPDKVRILTVHQAKGLEAPMVILMDCGDTGKRKDTYDVLVDWPADKAHPDHFLLKPSAGNMDELSEQVKHRLEEHELLEQNNLLYVALTRARQHLVISGHGKSKDQSKNDWYHLLEPYKPQTQQMKQTVSGDAAEPPQEKLPPDTSNGIPRHRPPPAAEVVEIHPNTLVNISRTSRTAATETSQADRLGTLRGEVIHCTLQLLGEKKLAEDNLPQAIRNKFPLAAQHLAEWIEHARSLVNHPDLRVLFDDRLYQQTLNEAPILFTHDGDQYFGIVDRVCISTDSVWVVDYKTHAAPARQIEELKVYYADQMRAYHLGATKLWPGRAVRTSLLLTQTRTLCDYDF